MDNPSNLGRVHCLGHLDYLLPWLLYLDSLARSLQEEKMSPDILFIVGFGCGVLVCAYLSYFLSKK